MPVLGVKFSCNVRFCMQLSCDGGSWENHVLVAMIHNCLQLNKLCCTYCKISWLADISSSRAGSFHPATTQCLTKTYS